VELKIILHCFGIKIFESVGVEISYYKKKEEEHELETKGWKFIYLKVCLLLLITKVLAIFQSKKGVLNSWISLK